MKRSLLLLTLLVMTVISASCSPYSDFANNDYSGETLNREILSSIAASIFTNEDTSSVNTESISKDSTTETIAADTEIVTEADASSDDSTIEEDRTEPQDIDSEDGSNRAETQEEICYWTRGGEVWHKSADCRYLKNSKEIVSGTVEDAIEAGKERACSSCFK